MATPNKVRSPFRNSNMLSSTENCLIRDMSSLNLYLSSVQWKGCPDLYKQLSLFRCPCGLIYFPENINEKLFLKEGSVMWSIILFYVAVFLFLCKTLNRNKYMFLCTLTWCFLKFGFKVCFRPCNLNYEQQSEVRLVSQPFVFRAFRFCKWPIGTYLTLSS